MPRHPKYSPAEKAAFLASARDMQRNGIPRWQIAESLGLNPASLTGWLREESINRLYPSLPPTLPRNRASVTNKQMQI